MAKQIWKPTTIVSPVPPVMVSCGSMEKSNIITIAWTGTINTTPAMTYISVKKERYSYDIIKNSGEFVINLTTSELVRACDYCGVKSGAKVDKFTVMGLEKEKMPNVSCPAIKNSPVNIECRVVNEIELGSHNMFLAKVLSVSVDETLLDKNGKLRLDKASLVAYSHGEYFELGKKLGTFGFTVKKAPSKRK
ncbi:MAG: flavin reductase family protein [Oscillospiraceae bacterium]